jgi:type 1 fimbria pilin
MTNAEIGLTGSSPTLDRPRPPLVVPGAQQNESIQVTYTPSSNTCTCSPSSVTFNKGNSGNVGVSIGLSSGATGSVVFGNPPINWGSGGAPTGASVNPSNGGGPRITITNPNSSAGTYSFTVNYVYTPTSGPQVTGTGDPTIINEGTGNPEGGDDDRQGDQGQDGVHRH